MKRCFLFFIFIVMISATGCSKLKEHPTAPVTKKLTYEEDIRPLLTANCVSCHGSTNPAGRYDLSSYIGLFGGGSDTTSNAIPGDSNSLLVTVTQPGGREYVRIGSAENSERLRKWVVEDSLVLAQPTVHPTGWLDPESSNFHGKKIREANWSFKGCTSCHGADYTGGITRRACTVCHTGSPEACGTCHGGPDNAAPPMDLTGARETSARGVGAHQTHVREGKITRAFDCTECHIKPKTFAEHFDSTRGDKVIFGARARGEGTEKGTKVLPLWDGATLTCRNTYCHGAFTNGNQDYAPAWTQPKLEAEVCGTCHELPPSSPHPPVVPGVLDCVTCHPKVVDKDRLIIDRELHINGKVELF